MSDQPATPAALLATRPPRVQWLVLAVLSLLFAAALELARLPAALLIGPMLAAVVVGVNGGSVRVGAWAFNVGQAVVGVLVASAISTDIFSAISRDWPQVAVVVFGTVAASSFLGWLISRWRIMPGTTAVWGSAPGAATAMVLMAEAFGADARLVAFMQYLRVIMVSVAAALVARLWVDTSGVEVAAVEWFPAIDPVAFGATLAAGAAGGLFGRLVRLPSPFFLGSFLVASALHLGADVAFQCPEWLLAASYTLIGWTIGLKFTRPILMQAARALPQVVGAILALMGVCGAMAWVLAHSLGVDPLTAYLATSPGGMDSVAIIAAASGNVDISFVMALQLARFLVVLLLGPSIARAVARLVKE